MSVILDVRDMDGTVVVALQGEIDLQNSPELRKELLASLASRHDVVVDLARVDYIDSSGVASLIEGLQAARRSSLKFSLAAASAAVMRVLKLARLDEVFAIHASVDEATKGH